MPRDNRAYLALLRDRPGQLGLASGRYDVIVAYLLGQEDAGGAFLIAFEEWLLQHYGGASNRSWPALVSELALSDDVPSHWADWTVEQHDQALSTLWEALEGYFADRERLLGLRMIYRGYFEWERTSGQGPAAG